MREALLKQLERYSNQPGATQELEDWLVANLQDLLDTQDKDLVEIASRLDALLLDIQEGLASEADLVATVEGSIRSLETVVSSGPPQVEVTSSSADTSAAAVVVLGQINTTVKMAFV